MNPIERKLATEKFKIFWEENKGYFTNSGITRGTVGDIFFEGYRANTNQNENLDVSIKE